MQKEHLPFLLPHIKINTSDHTLRAPGRKICDMHFHGELEFLYVAGGQMCCHTDDHKYCVNSGEVIFINSLTPHYTETLAENTRIIMVQFANPSQISGSLKYLARYLLKTDLPCFIFRTDDEYSGFIKEKIEAISTESREKKQAYEHFMVAGIYEITAVLYRKQLLPDEEELLSVSKIKSIIPIIELINEEYAKEISLRDISRALHLNESHICRLFKKATGGTVMDYLNFVRICKAEKLLRSGHSITDVSAKTGFSSQSYFNKVFKKYNSCSPSAYRKSSDLAKNHFIE